MKKEVMKEVAQLSQFDEELYRVSECAEPSVAMFSNTSRLRYHDAASSSVFQPKLLCPSL
jgi:seryl-tRNA synthetase